MPWPVDFTCENLFIYAERVVVEKWRIAGQHFVDENPYFSFWIEKEKKERRALNRRTSFRVRCLFK